MFTLNPVHTARRVTCTAAVAASVFAVQSTALGCVTPLQARHVTLAEAELAPASKGATLVSGIGVFNTGCQPPVGSPPDDLGDYPAIDLTGSLNGCWYTYVSKSQFNPSGTYLEQGTETFIRDDLHLYGEVRGRHVRGGDPRSLRTQDRGWHRGLRGRQRRDPLQGRDVRSSSRFSTVRPSRRRVRWRMPARSVRVRAAYT